MRGIWTRHYLSRYLDQFWLPSALNTLYEHASLAVAFLLPPYNKQLLADHTHNAGS